MEVAEVFVANFKNLQGTTLAEKKRNFYDLLHTNSSLSQHQKLLDTIISQITVDTYLEQVFFAEFLIYFRCFKELSNEFLRGNDLIINKISKQDWFFKKLLEENTPDFVNHFLPSVSYSLRIKILRKLALLLNEEQSDQIFVALHNRYGVFIASNILISCSCVKIEYILKNFPINLMISQLKLLYNKKPALLYIYLEERVKHLGNSTFLERNPIVQFIASKDPEMFCQMQEKYKLKYCSIGKRSTKRIVQLQKDRIIAKPELYATSLNAARLVRKLGRDFEKVYFKLFTKSIDLAFFGWHEAAKLLRFYPKHRQFYLFKSTFDRIFYDSMEVCCSDVPSYNYPYLLEIITENTEREKWARLKLHLDKNNEFIKYFTAPNCIDALKPKCLMLNQPKKAEYIATMTESCVINKDWEALLTVCELLCTLKDNEQEMYVKFLQVLTKNEKIFNNFTDAHWQYIKQIVLLAKEHSVAGVVIFKYLESLCKKGAQVENEMVDLLKGINWLTCISNFKFQATIERTILLMLIKVAPKILNDENTIEKVDICLILACKSFCLRFSNYKINVFDHPRLILSMKDALSSEAEIENLGEALEWLICMNIRNEEVENLIRLCWGKFEQLASINLIYWFLKNRPSHVIEHKEKIFGVITGRFGRYYYGHLCSKSLWRFIKYYSHLQMDQLFIEHCLSQLNDEDFDEKTALTIPLSILMPSKDFIRLVETYKPNTSKVDLLNDEENEKFQLQRNFLKSLVNINDSKDVMSVLWYYLNGDYVASCLSALNSCLYKIPENEIKPILDKICSVGAVSVKKHGFYFVCITQKESDIIDSLKSCNLSQSIAMSYQHFIKNPSELSWELVEKKLEKLDNNDHFTCQVLINRPAPKNYKSKYFETAYEIFKKKKNRFTNVLVNTLQEEVIGQLSSKFLFSIKNDFLTMKRSEAIFTYYLLYCTDHSKFEVIFDALKSFKERCWSLRSREAREKLNTFIFTVYELYIKWDNTDETVMADFMDGFKNIFTLEEAFEEFVILSLMKFKSKSMTHVCKGIIEMHNIYLNNYGKLVFAIFSDCAKKSFDKIYTNEASKLEFCSLLFENVISVEDVLLVLNLLPLNRPQLRECATLYCKLLDKLQNSENETIQLHLNRHLRQEKSKN